MSPLRLQAGCAFHASLHPASLFPSRTPVAVLLHNLVMLSGPAGKDPAVRDGHLFSAYLMMPLAATTLALLTFNWYPAQVGGTPGKAQLLAPAKHLTCSATEEATLTRSSQVHPLMCCAVLSTAVPAPCRCLWGTPSLTLRGWRWRWQAFLATSPKLC